MKASIIIPAGSGKTTLSNKYKELYDIDSFHSKQNLDNLKNLYKEVSLTGDWEKYNLYETSLIKNKINKIEEPSVLLLHCKEKSDLLNLNLLGCCKIDEKTMDKVATERGKTNKLRETQTRENWKHCDASVFESYKDIENYVLHICNENNIKLNRY